MKTKNIFKSIILGLLLVGTVTSCGYDTDLIEELSVSREFAPISLTARVRNQTIVELNWTIDDNVDHYVVEISADDPNFTTIFKTVDNVTGDQLPIQIQLEGLTLYSIRVKGISDRGLSESTWAVTQAETLSEQIMLPIEPGDIQVIEATLKWEAGLNVTHFILQPGDIRYDITDQEKVDGIATIPGLIGDTTYAATLYNNTKIRGTADFLTEVDPSTGTVISTTDDLLQEITNAGSGEILLLEPGDYTAYTGTVSLDKSITIRGLLSYDKPIVSNSFEIVDGGTDISFINLELDGKTTLSDVVAFEAAGSYNSLVIKGCNIHDYTRSLIQGHTTDALIQTVTVENCVVTDIISSGGDFIDFRNSDVFNLNVTTSTFDNCAPDRDFIRIDDAGSSSGGIGFTSNVLVESCTLYKVANSSSKRIVYVRFDANEIEIRNTLITDSPDIDAISDRDQTDEEIIFVNNNYFNAPALTDPSETRYDPSATTLDPGFVDPEAGDFTITNQTLIDNQVGDPRWRP